VPLILWFVLGFLTVFLGPLLFWADSPTVDGITSARPLYENLVEDDIVFFQFTLQNEGQGVVSNWYFTPIGITKIS
jgi:hypothetical protein